MDVLVCYDGKVVSESSSEDAITITTGTRALEGFSLTEQWVTVTNRGDRTVRVERVDSVCFTVPPGEYELMYFTSGWGQEFESVREPLEGDRVLRNGRGRSSHGLHPWFALVGEDGRVISGSVMWSGNWIVRFERLADGGYRISAGLDDAQFCTRLAPGQSMESPHVAIAHGSGGDLNETSQQFARAGRTMWYPRNAVSEALLVEWNHWWSYEDKNISEEVFKGNVDAAARFGFDVCTLDAGWFGPSDPGTHWGDYRGDWDVVNAARFPSGLRRLSDYTHEKGLRFGLWCEIDGLGQHARLAETHPAFVARRDGARLGYVCFGNPEARDWAYRTLDRIITEYRCDWVKLDFNLDPGAGCDRTDHGHGAGDGLYAHYRGYYQVLAGIREKHPDVVLENCSSGGLRIDLGILGQTHTTFLSDPDWTEHNLQLFWGASTMLAPNVCLHWGYSEWIGQHPHQNFHPHDARLTEHQLDYHVRASMLGGMGFSQKLPDLPAWVADRYRHHIQVYKQDVRAFVAQGDLYRLTEQPKREGRGERWAAFQYAMPDQSEHLLFVFRLHQSEAQKTIRLKGLQRERNYTLAWLSDDRVESYSGAGLMDRGLTVATLREEESSLIRLQ